MATFELIIHLTAYLRYLIFLINYFNLGSSRLYVLTTLLSCGCLRQVFSVGTQVK